MSIPIPPPGPPPDSVVPLTGIWVAFTWYPPGHETTVWVWMPAVPAVGDTVHIGGLPRHVKHVSWTDDHPEHPGWHVEVSLS